MLRVTHAVAIFLVCMINSPLVFSKEVPIVIFTDNSIYLSADPKQQAKIGERLSLMDLGRRFASCRVTSEYYQGDDEGIETTITCRDVAVSVNMDENGKIYGFWTTSKGAAFANNVQVGDKVVDAIGSTAHCNLCTEDRSPFCHSDDPKSTIVYDVEYSDDNCAPLNLDDANSCAGKHQIKTCVSVIGLGHGGPNF